MLSITRNRKDESTIIYVEPHKGAEARCGIWMDGAVWDGERFGNDGLVRAGMEGAKGQNVLPNPLVYFG